MLLHCEATANQTYSVTSYLLILEWFSPWANANIIPLYFALLESLLLLFYSLFTVNRKHCFWLESTEFKPCSGQNRLPSETGPHLVNHINIHTHVYTYIPGADEAGVTGRAAATAACTIAWIWSCSVVAVMVMVDAALARAGASVPVTAGSAVDITA